MKSELSDGLKIGFFRATVETVLYGSTAWTLTQSLDKKFGGAYTKLPRMVKKKKKKKKKKTRPGGRALQMRCFMQDFLGSQPQLERGALFSASLLEE